MLAQRCIASETEELEQSWSEGMFLEDLGMEVQHLAMELLQLDPSKGNYFTSVLWILISVE